MDLRVLGKFIMRLKIKFQPEKCTRQDEFNVPNFQLHHLSVRYILSEPFAIISEDERYITA